MLQYSVYVRFCTSRKQANTYLSRIEKIVPSNGLIRGLFVTEKQFADMPILLGNLKMEECVLGDEQLVFWWLFVVLYHWGETYLRRLRQEDSDKTYGDMDDAYLKYGRVEELDLPGKDWFVRK